MSQDRQTARWAEARARHHEATMAHRAAVHELEAAAAELTTAGAALSERVRLTSCRPAATPLPSRDRMAMPDRGRASTSNDPRSTNDQ